MEHLGSDCEDNFLSNCFALFLASRRADSVCPGELNSYRDPNRKAPNAVPPPTIFRNR
jgi:hypothetical protein